MVRRDRPLRLLAQSSSTPFVLVRAPAGYGKSTLLGQWAERDDRPFGWITADEGPPRCTFERAAQALELLPSPAVVVLDGAGVEVGFDELDAWARALPRRSQLALATRSEPRLPLGNLRAHGLLAELGAAELAMTRREAAAMLSMAGVELDPGDLAALLRHTEGWPAALHLAAHSIRGGRDPHAVVTAFAGDDRLIADYLHDEILTGLPEPDRSFLLRSSVLARLSGPACDAIARRAGSGTTLRALSRAGVPLLPLDHSDDEYRLHPLLAEMLQAEQRRSAPLLLADLHRRAGAWLEQRGEIDDAVEHAIAAGDLADAGRRLWSIAGRRIGDGRVDEIRAWLGRLRVDQIASQPALALTAASTHVVEGDCARIEYWLETAEQLLAAGTDVPQSAHAARPMLRAMLARNGTAAMVDDGAAAYELAARDDAWRPLACMVHGAGLHLMGNREGAVDVLEEGARCGGVTAPSAQVLCLAQLALLRACDEDWEEASLLASRARSQLSRAAIARYPITALVHAASALVRAYRDRLETAQEDRRQAVELLERLVDPPPWYALEVRVALARTSLRLGDAVRSRALIADAERDLRHIGDAPLAARWVEECRTQADTFASSVLVGPALLTTAELRVLRLLPTHLSFREIGVYLHVTANTVKTHAHAIYRKLDACSRSEAVVQARGLGLLSASPESHP
jgi:LuxR family maltose regulon positive regulatory protein